MLIPKPIYNLIENHCEGASVWEIIDDHLEIVDDTKIATKSYIDEWQNAFSRAFLCQLTSTVSKGSSVPIDGMPNLQINLQANDCINIET